MVSALPGLAQARPGKADTISKVIHPVPRRAFRSSPQATVNNLAAPTNLPVDKVPAGSIASSRSRSLQGSSLRALRRTPVGLKAPVRMPERTSPYEGSCIRLHNTGLQCAKTDL